MIIRYATPHPDSDTYVSLALEIERIKGVTVEVVYKPISDKPTWWLTISSANGPEYDRYYHSIQDLTHELYAICVGFHLATHETV